MNHSKKKRNFLAKAMSLGTIAGVMSSMFATTALAGWDESVKVTGSDTDADDIMGKVIGILLSIARYVGVGLIIYGVYEVVTSFMQNQPEAKTKGIVMALSGAALTGMKTILKGMGVIS